MKQLKQMVTSGRFGVYSSPNNCHPLWVEAIYGVRQCVRINRLVTDLLCDLRHGAGPLRLMS